MKIITKFLFYIAFCLIASSQLDAQTITSVPTVPAAHPRLFILPDQIDEIRAKIQNPEFAYYKNKVYSSSVPACLALKYLLEKNPQDGINALNKAYGAISNITSYTKNRAPFKTLFNAAIAFDYCYDLFGTSGVPSKSDFVSQIVRVCMMGPSSENNWAPVQPWIQSIVGHTVEGVIYNQVIAGIALYGDENSLYNSISQFMLDRMQKENNFFFPSHLHHQGAYIGSRHSHTLLTAMAFKTMTGGKNIFSDDLQYVPYQYIYFLRPDRQLMRVGDASDDAGLLDYNGFIVAQTANYFNDPYLRWLSDQNVYRFYNYDTEFAFFEVLYRPANPPIKSIARLPLAKYFPEPVGGEMITRTGWDLDGYTSPTAIVNMRIGNYYFGNHQHKDFGTFQIYYKGNLTGDSGMYKGSESGVSSIFWENYYRSTIAHNGLLIIDPNEQYSGGDWTNTAVDGGVRWPLNNDVQPDNLDSLLDEKNGYKYGEVIAHEFGPNDIVPEYSYISGDITAGYNYSNGVNKDKVKNVTRSMVTLITKDQDYPCVLVVYDRVQSTNPDFKKVFLLHSMNAATVQGNKVVIERGDGLRGKLVSYTQLPVSPEMRQVQGYRVGDQLFSPGTKRNTAHEALEWRVEVSPSTNEYNTEFLHVMVPMDNSIPDPTAEKIIQENLVGSKVLDRVVLFSRDGKLLSKIDIDLTDKPSYKVLACDVKPGLWEIYCNENLVGTQYATTEGQTIYFNTNRGNIKLVHKGDILSTIQN